MSNRGTEGSLEAEQEAKLARKERRAKNTSKGGDEAAPDASTSDSAPIKTKKKKTITSASTSSSKSTDEGAQNEIGNSESAASNTDSSATSQARVSAHQRKRSGNTEETSKSAQKGDQLDAPEAKKSSSQDSRKGTSAADVGSRSSSSNKDAATSSASIAPNGIPRPIAMHPDGAKDAALMAEAVRSNLMSPLTRVRSTGLRSRSGSSPGRSPVQMRAELRAETEKLAKAGNKTARRLLHRSKSESVVSMNSWDLSSTAGLRSVFTTDRELLARAQLAATRRTNASSMHLVNTGSSVALGGSFSPLVTKDAVAEQLLTPLRARVSGSISRRPASKSNSTSAATTDNIENPRPSSSSISSAPAMRHAATLRAVKLSSLEEESNATTSPIGSPTSGTPLSTPTSSPRGERNTSKRSLASFGRKSSYHQLGRTSSGTLPTFVGLQGTTADPAHPVAPDSPSSAGERAKSHMEAFLRFVSSHLMNPQIAEGIALMHGLLVPSTYLMDHLQSLFRGDIHVNVQHSESSDIASIRKEVINFIGSWVTTCPTDFADDFVLEKKLKNWIVDLRESSDRLYLSYALFLENIVSQSSQNLEALSGRVLTDAEITDMAEALKRGQDPAEVIALNPVVSTPNHAQPPPELARLTNRPKSISLEEAGRRESSKSMTPSNSASDLTSDRGSTPSPPPFSEPSFENMVLLAQKVSTRELRADARLLASTASQSTDSIPPSYSGNRLSPGTPSKRELSKSKSREELTRTKSKDDVSSSESAGKSKGELSKTKSREKLSPSNSSSSLTKTPSSGSINKSSNSLTDSGDKLSLQPDADELAKKPKFSKKLLNHLSEQVSLKETPLLLNVSPMELAKQWCLLDHSIFSRVRSTDMLLNVSKPSRSPVLTDIANRFNHATCWVALQILKIPNIKKRALAVAHMVSLAENLLNLTNLHGFVAVITGLSQHSVSRLSLTWKKVDPAVKKTFDALVSLASPIGNFRQLRSIHDNALPPFVPTPAMFLRDLLFVIDGNGGSFVQNGIIKTDMILLARKVLLRVASAQQVNYKFWGIEPIQQLILSGKALTTEELDSMSEKVESGRDL